MSVIAGQIPQDAFNFIMQFEQKKAFDNLYFE